MGDEIYDGPAAYTNWSGFGSALGSGLLGGIGSLGASLIGNTLGFSQSKKLMDYQYQLQQKAIDAANLYNHPANQVKRLAEAQLNPNLVYGHGVDGNQSSAASPSIANRNVDIANPLHDVAQNMIAERQLAMQEKTTEANVAYIAAKTLGQLLDNNLADATMEDNIKIAAQKLANLVSQESLNYSNISLNASRANQIEIQNVLTRENVTLTQLRQAVERAKPAQIRAATYKLRQEGNLTAKQVAWFDRLKSADLAKALQMVDYYYRAGLNQAAQGASASQSAREKRMANDYMENIYKVGGIKPADLLKLGIMLFKGK